MATRFVGIINTIVLVRLLAPADFGLVALATGFADVVNWFSAIGVYEALVREPSPDRDMYDTAFTVHFLKGVLVSLIMGGGAWLVADFFNEPRLVTIVLVLAFSSLVGAAENIGMVDFRRDLVYSKEFQLAAIPRVLAVVASICCAIIYPSYWALIVGIMTNRVLRLILGYRMHPYRPRLSIHSWRRIIGFSTWTWLSAMVIIARDRIDTVVIGRRLGTTEVGVYSVGWEIGSLTLTELVEPLATALFAGLSEAQRRGGEVSEGFFNAVSIALLLTVPMGVGLSMVASPLVYLAFGPQWMQAVALVQVFALVCMVRVTAHFSGVLFSASGNIHVQFRILLAGLIARVILLLALIGPLGLMGAAIAAIGCVAVEEVLSLIVTFSRYNLSPMRLLRGNWRCFLATAVMIAVLLAEGIGWAQSPTNKVRAAEILAVGVLSGAITYSVALIGAWFVAGRPQGAERTVTDLAHGMLRHGLRRVGSRSG
jgi:lipopolysaccharide exporter